MNIAPSVDLAPWVRCYHLMEFDAPPVEVPGVALAHHCMLINYGDIMQLDFAGETVVTSWEIGLGGILKSPWSCHFQRSVRLIAVELRADTLHHLIRDSVSMLTNQTADIRAFGLRVDNALMDMLRHPEAEVAEKIAALENYLRPIIVCLPDNVSMQPSLLANLETLKQRPYAGGDFDYTEVHLRREFVRKFGVSPHEYRDIVRIIRACGYLANPVRISIAQIAQELGFYDAPHFNRAFKRHTAMTPTEYRDQANANPLGALHQI